MKRWRTGQSIQQRARELRHEQTPAERTLWARLRRKQLYGLRFRRQHPIGRFIVDFYCASAKVAIEIDGPVHLEQRVLDEERTRWLADRGYTVLRFTNEQVERQVEQVLCKIAEACRIVSIG